MCGAVADTVVGADVADDDEDAVCVVINECIDDMLCWNVQSSDRGSERENVGRRGGREWSWMVERRSSALT